MDQPAPFPRRAHQDGRQSLCHRAGGRLPISPLDGQRPSTSGERETEHPLRPVRGHMSLRHQQGLPKPLLPAGKAGAVGHCTGQAIPVREDGGADAPCLQQQPLLPAHGQRVVFPAGEAALVGILPPEQAVACLVGQPSEALSAQGTRLQPTGGRRSPARMTTLPAWSKCQGAGSGRTDTAGGGVQCSGSSSISSRGRRAEAQASTVGNPSPWSTRWTPPRAPRADSAPSARSASLTAVSRGRR